VETLRNAWKTGRRSTRVIVVVAGVLMACCCGVFGLGAADSTMRATGILPTYTATPTETPSSPTPVPPTATRQSPPTETPPSPTPLPPTATPQPTRMPPTATPQPLASGPHVVIGRVSKSNEYVDLTNEGNLPQDLSGWGLLSERGAQSCELQGEIAPGETLRVWAMTEDRNEEGFCCDFESPIWNNDEIDLAVLFDAQGHEVDRK